MAIIDADVMALADQRLGRAHGVANPALYAVANAPACNDIVDPPTTMAAVRSDFINSENALDGLRFSRRTFNQTGTLRTIPCYNDATGVGTPNGELFLSALGN